MFKLKLETIKRSWPKVDNTPKSFYTFEAPQDEYQNHFGHASKQFAEGGDVLAIKTRRPHIYLIPQLTLFKENDDEAITRENECLWQDILLYVDSLPDFLLVVRIFLSSAMFLVVDYNLKLASFLICFVIQFGQV